MPMLEQNRQPETNQSPFDASSDLKQRRQMLIALALLLAALIVVLYKDWQFWFPSTSTEHRVASTRPKLILRRFVLPANCGITGHDGNAI